MKRTTRLTAGLVATAALAAPSALATAEAAKPGPTVKGQSKQLLKDIAVKDARLARLSTSNAVARLADDVEAELVTNIADARTELAAIKTAVEAADSTVDTRAARKELRSFRVENFRLVVNILKQSEVLTEAAAADPEASAALTDAEAAALAIVATSTKADIRAARAYLDVAREELGLDDETETSPSA